jgi:hypothetical protein
MARYTDDPSLKHTTPHVSAYQEPGAAAAALGGGQNAVTFWLTFDVGQAADGSLAQTRWLATRL